MLANLVYLSCALVQIVVCSNCQSKLSYLFVPRFVYFKLQFDAGASCLPCSQCTN